MFNLLMKIPYSVFVAVSGGPDSMAVLDFLSAAHKVEIVHFNHGTKHGMLAEKFVRDYARKKGLPIIVGGFSEVVEPPKGVSAEQYWREERYCFFGKIVDDRPLVLAHNLDDAVETWIFTSVHGKPRLIPERRDFIIRPFLTVKKSELQDWCKRKEVPYLEDPSNLNLKYARSRIRNVVLPELLKINPGIYKVISKKYQERKGE